MLIINNAPRLCYINVCDHETTKDPITGQTYVQVVKPRKYKLIPGMPCNIPDEDVALAKKNKVVKALFDDGTYRVMSAGDQPEPEVMEAAENPDKQDAETKQFMLDALKAAGSDKFTQEDDMTTVRDAYEAMLSGDTGAVEMSKDDYIEKLAAAGALDKNDKPYDARYSVKSLKAAYEALEG